MDPAVAAAVLAAALALREWIGPMRAAGAALVMAGAAAIALFR